ncbi:hypothetical protein GCM10011352_26150 [Marinobacterium zhoushanense]|uniref:Uncharacterized protein n=1 Tax=Marinobacterium zhoushanense TaxID=1679163 RepID=A0ABQ1KKB1_9GAMM|nr:hypothetical protein [Marinobacterium zhoushanense]GGB98779.1 hypothetical protein GCM10011352_26150 [Marinobacterium zhoushanense]
MNIEHHTTEELHRLLKRGYSADDLRHLQAPADLVEQALAQYQEHMRQRQHDRNLHSQATYAMSLHSR